MNGRMERKVYNSNKIEYIWYPFTEYEAKIANWPCEMCEHNFGCHIPEKKVCLPGQCQNLNRRAKGFKPLNFKLQTSHLLHTCRRGTKDTNRTATEEQQKERIRRMKKESKEPS